MASLVATTSTPSQSASHPPQPVPHQYGTRIRSNSVIRPSARLRQSPDIPPTRRIKPAPSTKSRTHSGTLDSPQPEFPPFPPPHITLHADDANNKIFIAIGRAFMSVDNCAMTIKDLAEMGMKYGLVCQNASAAGQAITTYIRNHLHRCEVQQDHPLLLRHVLSGTPSDDELAPALYSRVGGAHCTVNSSDSRATNFRRGTMVWYLSKATGAPCPFSRAGIRLCDYTENGKIGVAINPGKERKRERDRLRRAEQCGQKRKRLLRACADKGSASESSDEDERPPKVKLTLRLKPTQLSSSQEYTSLPSSPPSPHGEASPSPEVIDISNDPHSDDSSVSTDSSDDESQPLEAPWSLPPYPRRSISIPCYTPSVDNSYPSYFPSDPSNRQRSPSLPISSASDTPPPDSDDEGDFHISMTGGSHASPGQLDSFCRLSDDEDAGDLFQDHDPEVDTQWGDSPAPQSPSAQFDEDMTAKREPKDIQGLLHVWDEYDVTIADRKVLDVVTQAAAGLDGCSTQAEFDNVGLWGWDDDFIQCVAHEFSGDQQEPAVIVKHEDVDPIALPRPSARFGSPLMCDSPLSPLSTYSPAGSPRDATTDSTVQRHPSELVWQDADLLGPDSVQPDDLEDGIWCDGEIPSSSKHDPSKLEIESQPPISSEDMKPDSSGPGCDDTVDEVVLSPQGGSQDSPASIIVSDPPPPPTVIAKAAPDPDDFEGPVVVHTCQPCVPAICATELEGISVYQMTLGSSLILRRIDTDFVKVSPILDFLGLELPPLSSIPHCVDVSQGSYIVSGVWAPTSVVRQIVHDQPLVGMFLSDQLNEQFPSALQDFHRSNAQGRSLNQFGPHFRSTLEAKRESLSAFRLELPSQDMGPSWDKAMSSPWEVEDHLLSVHPPFALAGTVRTTPTTTPETAPEMETPLSPTEEEMFRTLCSVPDWEISALSPPSLADDHLAVVTSQDRPLRRSKRVSTPTTAGRSGTRSSKRGSRSSLS